MDILLIIAVVILVVFIMILMFSPVDVDFGSFEFNPIGENSIPNDEGGVDE